jgi:hypothetical protein
MPSSIARVGLGSTCCAIALLPIVFICLLLAAVDGSSIAWSWINDQSPNYIGDIAGLAVAVMGPAALIVATLRTRPIRQQMTRRVLRIEGWTLIAALPSVLIILIIIIMAAAVI